MTDFIETLQALVTKFGNTEETHDHILARINGQNWFAFADFNVDRENNTMWAELTVTSLQELCAEVRPAVKRRCIDLAAGETRSARELAMLFLEEITNAHGGLN
jgi:hypothetical protein